MKLYAFLAVDQGEALLQLLTDPEVAIRNAQCCETGNAQVLEFDTDSICPKTKAILHTRILTSVVDGEVSGGSDINSFYAES